MDIVFKAKGNTVPIPWHLHNSTSYLIACWACTVSRGGSTQDIIIVMYINFMPEAHYEGPNTEPHKRSKLQHAMNKQNTALERTSAEATYIGT